MSFFGFDPSFPRQQPPQGDAAAQTESYDFQDTYDGLGEDAFNDETFGEGQPWADPAGASAPDARRQPAPGSAPVGAAPPRQHVSYAQAAAHPSNDVEFMQELWGQPAAPPHVTGAAPPPQEKKMLSLEEIEAQLTAIDHAQMRPPPPQFGYGMMPPQYGGYMGPPGGFMPPPGQYGQFMGPVPMMFPGQQPGPGPHGPGPQPQGLQRPQGPQGLQTAGLQVSRGPGLQGPGPQVQAPPVMPQGSHGPSGPQGYPQVAPQLSASAAPASAAPASVAPAPVAPAPVAPAPVAPAESVAPASVSATHGRRPSKVNSSQFPVLGAKEQPHAAPATPAALDDRTHFHDLSPDQQAKVAKRQEKVARIMKYSGIMNPKDKDYVTRFQLSQIVTEDPYNEDFYAQVFKVIHPKTSNQFLEHLEQHNSIAQAYLEQSGHRLGGRYKRADVALQRMQQQVQKAVTVAKERPKLTQYAREGALGKILISSGKKPRQQLELFSQAAKLEIEKQEREQRERGEDPDAKAAPARRFERKSRPSDAGVAASAPKKLVMGILENIIAKVMTLESQSRVLLAVDTTELWQSLHILDAASPTETNPFIQCLDHSKALKILPRLFKFLSREQVLTIVTLIMSNLQNLAVIKQGLYTTYADQVVPAPILRLIDTYSLTFSKVLMNAVQDFKFNEIIGLLVILIEHNNVAFVSTTKIGLSILTTLLARAELIKGGEAGGVILATDLSEWLSCYDELFTALESRISDIFPPNPQDIDDGLLRENYVWQFLATLSLGGKLSHQRIIVDEVRDQIFGVMNRAKQIDNTDLANLYKKQNLLNNLNMYLVVMGLVADENEIKELQT